MSETVQMNRENPLGTEKVSKLMTKFAVPSIIAMLVGALYNIVDQLFIGQKIGILGNAATNIAFPFSTSCVAIGLLFGIGGASCFNLYMGKGETKKAPFFLGNSAAMLCILGFFLTVASEIWMEQLLKMFGSPEDVLPYAMEYCKITAIGFPFMILTTGGGHLIRADGRPQMTMFVSLLGAVINTVLDALFVLVFEWGMAGAALATVIGQIISAVVVFGCLAKCKTVTLTKEHILIKYEYISLVAKIGVASFFNQLAIMLVQIILNNSLKTYGALSVYGESVPVACAGIVMKVSMIVFSVVIGLGQGTQPIESFNYGAARYDRVKEAYRLAVTVGVSFAVLAFICFQLFPRQIIGLFGEGTPEYFEFGERFFRIFLFFTWLNALQPITSTFFTSIGKPYKGIFLSLTRQIIFFIPTLLILPVYIGIDGILYTGPIADGIAGVIAIVMAVLEFEKMNKLEQKNETASES